MLGRRREARSSIDAANCHLQVVLGVFAESGGHWGRKAVEVWKTQEAEIGIVLQCRSLSLTV